MSLPWPKSKAADVLKVKNINKQKTKRSCRLPGFIITCFCHVYNNINTLLAPDLIKPEAVKSHFKLNKKSQFYEKSL